jgi:DNA-binding NarL/FixJ family response regulator
MFRQVLVITEQRSSGESIRRALRHARGCHVAGGVDGRMPSAAEIANIKPHLVLVDEMRTRSVTLARIREVRAAAPGTKIALVTRDLRPDALAEATEAGADAALGRSMDAMTFAMVVSAVVAGQLYYPVATVGAPPASRGGGVLTARELQVLEMVSSGASNGRIAKSLWVTEQTVKYHLSNIYRKLDVSNRTQASYYAHVHGLFGHGAATVPAATTDRIAA